MPVKNVLLSHECDFPPQLGHFFIGIQKKSHEVTTLHDCNFFELCQVGGWMCTEHDHSPAPRNFPLFFHINRGMRSIAIGREKGRGDQEEGMREFVQGE